MRGTFRNRLLAIVGAAGLGLIVILITSAVVEQRVNEHITTIREQYIPKIGLREKLQTGFERVSRALRDAADASDLEGIDLARRHLVALQTQIAGSRDAIAGADADALRRALDDYYTSAEAVTRRMIRGDAGEDLPLAQQEMQAKQSQVDALIVRAGQFDEIGLAAAFAAVVDAQETGANVRLALSLASLGLVLALSLWISRGLYRSLADLGTGFRRFGEGKLDVPIAAGDDELGEVAQDANQMAERLQRLGEERDRNVWLKAGQVGLSNELRGELAPGEVANRAVAFVARYVGAPAAIVYYADGDVLAPIGHYGVATTTATFTIGDGLVGEAARRTELTTVAAPAGRIPIRSGFASGDPSLLVLVPLVHANKVRGVLELAILAEWKPEHEELVLAVRDSLAIALEVARARSATHELLDETQRQATELLAARRGLEQKAEELARASEYKSQFLASMSHELRTPLNAIIGFSELIYDGTVPIDSPESHEFVGDILTSGRHLLQLINDVLDLSKVEAGKLEFHPEPAELTTVIGEVVGILKAHAAKRRVTVTTTIAPEIDQVTLDPARLKQVFYNYLSNALKFTSEGGRVEVRALADGAAMVRLEVEDTGIGIDAASIAKLFSDFQQTREGERHGGGTGLGLALTKRLVEAQGGSVGVTSIVGKGSVFHAVLPRHMTTSPPQPVASSGKADAPLVLVIEHDAIDREKLVATLANAGYATDAVATAKQGLEQCDARHYDAITLDLLLPDMAGVDVLQRVRDSRNSSAPVVLVTVVDKGALAGFAVHDVLGKPLDERVLLASLTRAGVRTDRDTVLVVDDDPASRELMASVLRRRGYAVVCEADGASGLSTALARRPAAIVLDLVMPGMSGFEVLDQLRRDPAGRHVPVIVWTSKDLTGADRAALTASAHAVVAKGVDNARVVVELAAALSPASGVR